MRPGILRDAILLVGTFLALLAVLYAFTGSWPPAVIVESGSMMHAEPDVPFGRVGTIDPGDLVLVRSIKEIHDVTTLVEGGRERYGKAGDVIVYYPANDRTETPIIHRAVAYVEVSGIGDGTRYDVAWRANAPCEGGGASIARDGRSWCRYGAEGILIPSVPVWGEGSSLAHMTGYKPPSTGFLTKGDNPYTNRETDQLSGISLNARHEAVPVPIEWIVGEGRGELPWLGLLKLALAKRLNEDDPPETWARIGNAYAPSDLWVMLAITLVVIVVGPFAGDIYRAARARKKPPAH